MKKITDSLPWSGLRAISNSVAARCTVLIPLIGYLIIFNDGVSKYLNLVAELGGGGNSSAYTVSPRLLLIYFGLCAIAIGVTLYSIFCPNGVKYYGSANAYVGNVQGSRGRFSTREIEVELEGSPLKENFWAIRDSYRKTDRNDADRAEYRNGLLHLLYRKHNLHHPFFRLITYILYAIGFLCLLIPSAGVFVRVIRILGRIISQQSHLLF